MAGPGGSVPARQPALAEQEQEASDTQRRRRRPRRSRRRRDEAASPPRGDHFDQEQGSPSSPSGSSAARAGTAQGRLRGCPATGTSTSATSRPSETAASAGSATRETPGLPSVLELLLGLPGRHPGHRRQQPRRGGVTGQRPRHRPVRQRRLRRCGRLHRERDQPAPAVSARRQRDHAGEHQLRPSHWLGLRPRRLHRGRSGGARVLPTSDGKTSIFIGKTMGVFGIEYKERRSDQRFGITPSLIGRYTDGPVLGIKARSKLFNDWLILAGSVTQRVHDHRAVPLLQRDRSELGQDPDRPRRDQHPGRPPAPKRRPAGDRPLG